MSSIRSDNNVKFRAGYRPLSRGSDNDDSFKILAHEQFPVPSGFRENRSELVKAGVEAITEMRSFVEPEVPSKKTAVSSFVDDKAVLSSRLVQLESRKTEMGSARKTVLAEVVRFLAQNKKEPIPSLSEAEAHVDSLSTHQIRDLEAMSTTMANQMQADIETRDMLVTDLESLLGFDRLQSDIDQFRDRLFEKMSEKKLGLEARLGVPDLSTDDRSQIFEELKVLSQNYSQQTDRLDQLRDTIKMNFRALAQEAGDLNPSALLATLLKRSDGSSLKPIFAKFHSEIMSQYPDIEDPFRGFVVHLEKSLSSSKPVSIDTSFFTKIHKAVSGDNAHYKKLDLDQIAVNLDRLHTRQVAIRSAKPLRLAHSKLSLERGRVERSLDYLPQQIRVQEMITPEFQMVQKMTQGVTDAKTMSTRRTMARIGLKFLSVRIGRLQRRLQQNFNDTGVMGIAIGFAKTAFQATAKIVGTGVSLVKGTVVNIAKSAVTLVESGIEVSSVIANRIQRLNNPNIPKKPFDGAQTLKKVANAVWALSSAALIVLGTATAPIGLIATVAGIGFLAAAGYLSARGAVKGKISQITAAGISKSLSESAPKLQKSLSFQTQKVKTIINLMAPILEKRESGSPLTETEEKTLAQYQKSLARSQSIVVKEMRTELQSRATDVLSFLHHSSSSTMQYMESLQNAVEWVNWAISIAAMGSFADGSFNNLGDTIKSNFDVQSALQADTVTGFGVSEATLKNLPLQHLLFHIQDLAMDKVGNLESKFKDGASKDGMKSITKTANSDLFRASRQAGVQARLGLLGMGAQLDHITQMIESALALSRGEVSEA